MACINDKIKDVEAFLNKISIEIDTMDRTVITKTAELEKVLSIASGIIGQYKKTII